MAKVRIHNDSGDREFFTIIPNYILNHSTHTDQALYLQMKRFAGEDGECFATQETIMNKLGIGRKAYTKSLEYLLKRGWVQFIGTTGGKTRPIKTYKINNIWQENSEHFKKISSEREISKDTVQKDRDTGQKRDKIPSESDSIRRTSIKKNQEEDNTAGTSPAGDISEVILSFKEVNPMYANYFKNTTQRASVENLLKVMPKERLLAIVGYLPKSNASQYAPTITTPNQLERDLGKLIAWSEKQKAKKITKVAFV